MVRLLSEGMLLTFHRAFDVCSQDLQSAVEDIIAVGCDRILTSGRAADVLLGRETIQETVRLASGRIAVVAGCGVTASNVRDLIVATGVTGIHAGSSVTSDIDSRGIGPDVSGVSSDMAVWQCVDSAKAKDLVRRAHRGWDVINNTESNSCNRTVTHSDDPVTEQGLGIIKGGVDSLASCFSGGAADGCASEKDKVDQGEYIYLTNESKVNNNIT